MTTPDLSDTFYGHAAGLYDLVARAPGVTSWRERAVDSLALSPGDTVVEMGCGTGANFPALREAVGETGQVVGVDLVPAMLDRARNRIDAAGWENVHVVRGDATRPPVEGVDAVLSTFVVGMLADPEQVVREWADCVTTGGRVTLLNAERSPRLLAKPLNPAFRLFVRLGAPGSRLRRDSPARDLERKWAAACEGLSTATDDCYTERFGGGFVTLASGRVPVATPADDSR